MMIIALEGGVCSGKTTLCRQLQEKGFMHVSEHMTFLSPQDWERFGQIDLVHRIDDWNESTINAVRIIGFRDLYSIAQCQIN